MIKRHPSINIALLVACIILMAPHPKIHAGTEGKQAWQAAQQTGKELYDKACSSCHGHDGTGMPRTVVGYDVPLPDFTDCSFASREPDADWIAVAHEGGPVRAFDRMMPAFGEALSMDQLGMIMAHIRTFCGNDDWPPGELNLPRLLVTEKAYPEDEAVYNLGAAVEGQGTISNSIIYEKRFGARNQIEVAVPFGWREREVSGGEPASSEKWVGGLGDLAIGAKRALVHSLQSGSIFSVVGEFVLPTGDRDKGLGKGTTVFEPFASYGQILPSEFFIQSQAGVELPFDTDRADREAFWRLGLGRSFTSGRFGRSWSPMIEVLGSRELVSDKRVQWDIVPQLQVTLNRRQHVMVNIGFRLPLTDSGQRDTQLLIYLLWDWFDGGFFDGW